MQQDVETKPWQETQRPMDRYDSQFFALIYLLLDFYNLHWIRSDNLRQTRGSASKTSTQDAHITWKPTKEEKKRQVYSLSLCYRNNKRDGRAIELTSR